MDAFLTYQLQTALISKWLELQIQGWSHYLLLFEYIRFDMKVFKFRAQGHPQRNFKSGAFSMQDLPFLIKFTYFRPSLKNFRAAFWWICATWRLNHGFILMKRLNCHAADPSIQLILENPAY